MAERVPASKLDRLSELEEAAAKPSKTERLPVRAGSLLALPRAIRAAPAAVATFMVSGAILTYLSAEAIATTAFFAAVIAFVPALGALAIRLAKLERLRRRARPTTDPAEPQQTIDLGLGREVFQLEEPELPPGHPYRDRATAPRHFLLGDVAAARSMLRWAMAKQVAAGALGCVPLLFIEPRDADRELPLANMDRLEMMPVQGLSTGRIPARFPEQPRPAVADLNGDGLRDVIVITGMTAEEPGTGTLAAFDGTTLKRLWRSESRPVTWPAQPVMITSRHAFFVDATGLTTIHERESGTILQTVRLPDAKPRCFVESTDAVWFESATAPAFVLFGDEVAPRDSAEPPSCERPGLAQSGEARIGSMTWAHFQTGDYAISLGDDRILKERGLTTVRATSAARGTDWEEPYFLPEDRGSSFTPRAFDVGDERFYFAYELEPGGRRIGARSLETGKIAWSVVSEVAPTAMVRAVVETEDLLVLTETHLELLYATTGATLRLAAAP
jgi:hypothetical protein